MREITSMSALQLAEKIKRKEISVTEAVKAQLEAIFKREPIYNSYISVTEKEALSQAISVQKRIDNGELNNSPLAGVTIAIKDNICTKGIRTTCGSKILYHFIPSYDATVIEKLKEAGVIIVGKANLDEFAMGVSTKTSYFGTSKNPWNIKHSPGGSSGGSAAAVAAEEAHISLGSDTGGSIRQPSAFCGVVGIKPTYGTVSRYGLIAFASSLDQIGPICRNVSDCVALLEVISGNDPKDSTSIEQKSFSYCEALIDDVKGMKIGIPSLYFKQDMDEDVRNNFMNAINTFEAMGAEVEIFDFDVVKYCVQVYQVISYAEASSNLSRYDGVKYGHRVDEYYNLDDLYKKTRGEGFGYEVKRRLMMGAYFLCKDNYEKYYNKARKIRRIICEAYNKVFERYDVILCPDPLNTAPLLSEKNNSNTKNSTLTLNSSVNLAGLPAISIPCGKDRNGLPIGMQLIGKRFGEKDIIRAAYTFEQTRPYERPETL